MASTMILLAGLDPVSIVGLLSAGFAGLSFFLALRHPAGQLRRMTRRPSRFARPDNTAGASRPWAAGCTPSDPPCGIEHGMRVRPPPRGDAAGRLAWDHHVVERPSGLRRRHSCARLA